jgi:hypothetical protein
MLTTDFVLKLGGVFLGVLARALLPWLRKLRAGKVRGFDPRYLASAIGALLAGIIITLLVFPRFEAAAGGATFEAYFKLFATAFGFGFGWNAIVLEAGQWAGAFEEGPDGGVR